MNDEVFQVDPPPPSNWFVDGLSDIGRCIRRVVSCNFQKIGVTERESEKLTFSRTPISSSLVQSYAAWRRSALWIATAALLLHAVVLFASFERTETSVRRNARKSAEELVKQQRKQMEAQNPAFAFQQINEEQRRRQEREQVKTIENNTVKQLGKSNLQLVDTLVWLGHTGLIAGIILVLFSAVFWADLRRSRLLSRIGWSVMFFVPILLAFLPASSLMEFGHIDDPTVRKTVTRTLGVAIGLSVFVGLGAKVIAIFPGVIRSSMSLKTLLPESATPGWIVAMIAPLYALVLLLMLLTANQIGGSVFLLLGAICLTIAPAVYIVCAKALVRPRGPKGVSSVVNRIRLTAVGFNVLGIVFVSIFVIDLELLEFSDVVNFVLGLIGSVLLLTVVVSDLVVSLLRAGYLQSQDFQESRLRENLDRRFAALAEIGNEEAAGRPQFENPPPLPIPSRDRAEDSIATVDESAFLPE